MTPHKPILGLIGSIGSGKSTAALALARRGGAIVDADKLGHMVLDEPEVSRRLVARWGGSILKPDGSVNRRAVGDVVFGNPLERTALEAIVFPRIHAREEEAYRSADADPEVAFIVLDAAVLLEAGRRHVCSKLLMIDAPRSLRLTRVALRNGWDDVELTRREAAQLPPAEKRSIADAAIDNDGSVEELQLKIDAVLAGWGWLPSRADNEDGKDAHGRH